jgi:hypothetical protein
MDYSSDQLSKLSTSQRPAEPLQTLLISTCKSLFPFAYGSTGELSHLGTISNLNLFPPDIFSLLRRLAIQSGQSPEPLDGIVALGGLSYVPTADTSAGTIRKRSIPDYLIDADQSFADGLVSPSKYGANPGSETFEHMISPEAQVVVEEKAVSDREAMENEIYGDNSTALTISPLAKRSLVKRGLYTGWVLNFDRFTHLNSGLTHAQLVRFNLPAYVQTAFSALTVTVDLVSVLNIGEFQTNLAYSQSGVPAYTDSSLTMLLPILARPIVQKIVDGSILGVNTVLISNPTNTGEYILRLFTSTYSR